MRYLLDKLIPKQCVYCNRYGSVLCEGCKKQLRPTLPECFVCRKISKDFKTHNQCLKHASYCSQTFIAFEYDDIARNLMREFKLRLSQNLQTELIELLKISYAFRLLQSNINQESTILIPAPTAKKHLKERGFNHIRYISNSIAYSLHIDIEPNFILSKDITTHQAKLSRQKRLSRKNPYYTNPVYRLKSSTKNIIIFDDLITTGTTIKQIAEIIHSTQPSIEITALALFRPPIRKRKS